MVEGGGKWSWLERVEMRSNGVGPGCEHDLVQMLGTNSTLQVVDARVTCAVATDTVLQCLDIRFNPTAVAKQARLPLQLRAYLRTLMPSCRLWTSGTGELCGDVCFIECVYITMRETCRCYIAANNAATTAAALAKR